jgi:multidrug efflux pump
MATVRELADQVKAVMRKNPNAVGVNDNWNESVKVLRIDVDQAKLRALGLTSQALMQAANTILSGTTIGQFRENDRLIDIVIRQPVDERSTISALSNVSIPVGNGRAVPLAQLATPRFVWEPGVVWREGRDWSITVQSDVMDGIQGPTVSSQIDPLLEPIRATLPAGYTVKLAGAIADSGKAQQAIAANVPLVIFIVFTLLMLQLHSFSRSMLVFLTGPLGVAGAALALLMLQRPFGFVAQLGVIALVWHDHPKFGDSDRSDRARYRRRHSGLGCDCRLGGAAFPAHLADGRDRGAGHDSAVAGRYFGARWRWRLWAV